MSLFFFVLSGNYPALHLCCMIYFFTPYSFQKKMFDAWDGYMDLLLPGDYACMMDGDIMFLKSDFGHHIQKYTEKFPDTGLFTCYSSRSRTKWVMPERNLFGSLSIIEHKRLADRLYKEHHLDVKEINDRVTGHLMMMKKSTWMQIREKVQERCKDLNILSVDSVISTEVLAAGMKIRLMQGVYVLHYYRLLEGASTKTHLQ